MSVIEKLTPEQQTQLVSFRAEWFRWGTSTERADRAKAETAIRAMYQRVSQKQSPVFIWCASPATSLLAIHWLKSPQFNKWRASLWDSLGASLWDSLRASLRASLGNEWWGQHEAYWISFYLFCRDILSVKYDEERSAQLNLWRDIAQSCCWWWAYENYCIVSERPTVVSMDQRERIHSDKGPVIAFADGWSVFAVHGVRVPEYVVLRPKEISVAKIDVEKNAEVRRVMIDRFGSKRYLQESHAALVHQQHPDDPLPGLRGAKLWRKEVPNDEAIQMVELKNSTPEPDGSVKTYWLRVPPNMKTCREAVAWTFDLTPEQYNPIQES